MSRTVAMPFIVFVILFLQYQLTANCQSVSSNGIAQDSSKSNHKLSSIGTFQVDLVSIPQSDVFQINYQVNIHCNINGMPIQSGMKLIYYGNDEVKIIPQIDFDSQAFINQEKQQVLQKLTQLQNTHIDSVIGVIGLKDSMDIISRMSSLMTEAFEPKNMEPLVNELDSLRTQSFNPIDSIRIQKLNQAVDSIQEIKERYIYLSNLRQKYVDLFNHKDEVLISLDEKFNQIKSNTTDVKSIIALSSELGIRPTQNGNLESLDFGTSNLNTGFLSLYHKNVTGIHLAQTYGKYYFEIVSGAQGYNLPMSIMDYTSYRDEFSNGIFFFSIGRGEMNKEHVNISVSKEFRLPFATNFNSTINNTILNYDVRKYIFKKLDIDLSLSQSTQQYSNIEYSNWLYQCAFHSAIHYQSKLKVQWIVDGIGPYYQNSGNTSLVQNSITNSVFAEKHFLKDALTYSANIKVLVPVSYNLSYSQNQFCNTHNLHLRVNKNCSLIFQHMNSALSSSSFNATFKSQSNQELLNATFRNSIGGHENIASITASALYSHSLTVGNTLYSNYQVYELNDQLSISSNLNVHLQCSKGILTTAELSSQSSYSWRGGLDLNLKSINIGMDLHQEMENPSPKFQGASIHVNLYTRLLICYMNLEYNEGAIYNSGCTLNTGLKLKI